MDRRGAGMGPMMPFFPGSGLGDQPPSMPTPDMPSFPHMRERFPNSVWGAENQSQWGAFHPPNIPPPPMGPPSHNPHQFNQFEPRQPVFNFGGAGAAPSGAVATSVSQFNSGFNGQYNGVPEPASVYVPQGHFSPQAAGAPVPFNSGPPNGFLSHAQGNGAMGTGSSHSHPHPYPTTNEYSHHQQQQPQQQQQPPQQQQQHHIQQQQQTQNHHQQGLFKSPLPSPAVSAPDASPVQTGFAMTSLSSPHGSSTIPTDQSSASTVHTSLACRVPTYSSIECVTTTTLPQVSPHSSVASSNPALSQSNGGSVATSNNGNSTVQSRLKNMIMSRQGSNGSQSSAFSPGPGLTESPPLGELRFSGSVAAVTSVASSPDASQVQESFKMAQNFLAYRTTESDPGSVVQHTSGDEKGAVGDVDDVSSINKEDLLASINNTYTESKSQQSPFLSECQSHSSQNSGKDNKNEESERKDSSLTESSISEVKVKQGFKEPEEALEELFKGTEDNEIENLFKGAEQTDVSNQNQGHSTQPGMSFSSDHQNPKPPDKIDVSNFHNNSEDKAVSSSALPFSCSQSVPSSAQSSYSHLTSPMITTSVTSCAYTSEFKPDFPVDSVQLSLSESGDKMFSSDKSSNLSVYDFPDSPDQQPTTETRCSGFRLGRVRGLGAPTISTSSSQRPACASVPTTSSSGTTTVATRFSVPSTIAEGNVASDGGIMTSKSEDSSLPPLLSTSVNFPSHTSSAPAISPRNDCQTTSSPTQTFSQPYVLPSSQTIEHSNYQSSVPGSSVTLTPVTTTQSLSLSQSQPTISSQHGSNFSSISFQPSYTLASTSVTVPLTSVSSVSMSSLSCPSNVSSQTVIHASPPVCQSSIPSQSCQPLNYLMTSSMNQPSQNVSQPSPQSLPMQSPQSLPHTSPQNAPHPSPQNLPHLSPQTLPHLSPQNITHPSPQNTLSHTSPQTVNHANQSLSHPSPQTLPHSSPQNIHQNVLQQTSQGLSLPSQQLSHQAGAPLPHPSPQNVPLPSPQNITHPSPQAMPQPSPQSIGHPSQIIPPSMHPPGQTMHPPPQLAPQPSPQAIPQPSPQTIPQASPQAIPQPSPQPLPHQSPQSIPHASPQGMVHNQHSSQPMPVHAQTLGHGNQNVVHNSSNVRHSSPQIMSNHPSQVLSHHPPHIMGHNSHPYPNPYHHSYPQMNQNFPPQFHPQHRFHHPQMHMLNTSNQSLPFGSCQHPIKNMANLSMPPNMMQPCLQPEPVQAKNQTKKAPPKKARKTRMSKKQKLQQEKQQKEEMEKLRFQELQQEKHQKEEMEKLRYQEIQQQHQQQQQQQPIQMQHPQMHSFMSNKIPNQFFNHQPQLGTLPSNVPQHEFLTQQWSQGFTINQFHPQSRPQGGAPRPIQPHVTPPANPPKSSSKSQESKSTGSKRKSNKGSNTAANNPPPPQPAVEVVSCNPVRDVFPFQDPSRNSVASFNSEVNSQSGFFPQQQYLHTQQLSHKVLNNQTNPSNVQQSPIKDATKSIEVYNQSFPNQLMQPHYPSIPKPSPGGPTVIENHIGSFDSSHSKSSQSMPSVSENSQSVTNQQSSNPGILVSIQPASKTTTSVASSLPSVRQDRQDGESNIVSLHSQNTTPEKEGSTTSKFQKQSENTQITHKNGHTQTTPQLFNPLASLASFHSPCMTILDNPNPFPFQSHLSNVSVPHFQEMSRTASVENNSKVSDLSSSQFSSQKLEGNSQSSNMTEGKGNNSSLNKETESSPVSQKPPANTEKIASTSEVANSEQQSHHQQQPQQLTKPHQQQQMQVSQHQQIQQPLQLQQHNQQPMQLTQNQNQHLQQIHLHPMQQQPPPQQQPQPHVLHNPQQQQVMQPQQLPLQHLQQHSPAVSQHQPQHMIQQSFQQQLQQQSQQFSHFSIHHQQQQYQQQQMHLLSQQQSLLMNIPQQQQQQQQQQPQQPPSHQNFPDQFQHQVLTPSTSSGTPVTPATPSSTPMTSTSSPGSFFSDSGNTATLSTIDTTPLKLSSASEIISATPSDQSQGVPQIASPKKEIKTEPGVPIPDLEEERKKRVRINEMVIPKCSCSLPPGTQDPGPIYTHLGSGTSLGEVRKNIEERTGHVGAEVRIEKVIYTGKEGKTVSGCPLPKWIIRRSGPEEKVLVVVKNRVHHTCNSSWIVVVIVAWDGMSQEIADDLYSTLVHKLNKFGNPTERRCGTNEDRTCFCQGIEQDKCGSSFSFGCSWSMYYNMCKFARSKHTRKFKLTDEKEEQEVEEKLQRLATEISPVYRRFVPEAFYNQVALEEESLECRLGNEKGRPWTGVTACLDFCAHSHKDNHNMNNGCTVVATLTKHRGFSKPEDEQYHVLPLYVLDPTDEEGGYEGFHKKVNGGSLEVLTKYPCEIRLRDEPLLSCRARSLLARGLPLPNSHRNKIAKGKSKVKGSLALANLRRKSSEGDNLAKKKKSEVKEVTDKLGLDVDLTATKSNDGEENYEDLSKYNIESDDYSWLLDFGNDHADGERKKGVSHNKEETKEGNKVGDGSQLQTLGQSENGINVSHSFSVPSGVNSSLNRASPLVSEGIGQSSSMPPPPSPAPKRPLSPTGNMSPFSSSQAQQNSSPSPTLSPLSSPFLNSGPPVIHPQSPHNSQSPIESSLNTSSPSNFSSVSHFSPFSPQMPSLSPHGMQSSPSSPGKNVQNSNVSTTNATASMLANVSQAQSIPVVSTPGSLFSVSHNSPEMPRLSPHITLNSSQIPGIKSGEKPISGLVLASQPATSQLTTSITGNTKVESSSFEKVSSSTEAAETGGEKKQCGVSGQTMQTQSEINMEINAVGATCGDPNADSEKNPLTYVSFSENLDNFQNPDIGGVSIALSHRSVLFEYAKHELHATTALKVPDRRDPKRVSLIFYHHKSLIYRNHGWSELEKKMEKKKLEVEKLAKEGKVKPPPKKKKKTTKNSVSDKTKDSKLEGAKGPPNGIKRMKFDPKVEPQQPQPQQQQPQEVHPPGMIVDHKKGHLLSGKPATVYPPCNPTIPHHSDLISPPISYANYPRSLPSFVESSRPFSPSAQRNSSITPSFSLPSKSPHLITSQSPTLDQHQQKPNPTPDHSYISNHLNHIPGGGVPPPFNTTLQEFNPYNTPGSSPYHNHFSPYVDVQGNPNFPSYQSGNFFSKGPAPPLNYNTTTYVPQPFYGLTPPYSPGPQQPQQIPPHHPHHLQSQIPGPFSHGGLPPNMPSSLQYEDTLGRGPASQPTSTWSQMRHVPSFHVHGPYAPWPGS